MKKVLIIISLIILTFCGLFQVNYICASDSDSSGYCGNERLRLLQENNLYLCDDSLGLPYTHKEYVEYFKNEENIYEEVIIGEVETLPYTEEELELLAHLIFAEAGNDWCSDKMQQYTGSVVLNRIASPYFPDNMYDVVYQKGQYSVTRTGAINKIPNERAYNVARFLLENGSVLPSNVVFQSQHIQGDGIYEKVQNMYFCYKN